MASGLITSWQIDGETNGNSDKTLFSWAPKSLQMASVAMKNLKMLAPWKKSYLAEETSFENWNINVCTFQQRTQRYRNEFP